MNLVFGGISEGVFAFFIIFCTLVGMATGAYLMDRWTFRDELVRTYRRFCAILQNLPATFSCIRNRHDYKHENSLEFGETFFYVYRCVNCSKTTGRFYD